MADRIRRARQRQRLLAAVVERDGERCWYCGCRLGSGKRAATLDHVLLLAARGRSKPENLRLACARCLKAALGEDAFRASARLFARQRMMFIEELQRLGAVLPKRAYNHVALSWTTGGGWICGSCGGSGATSPTQVPCGTAERG